MFVLKMEHWLRGVIVLALWLAFATLCYHDNIEKWSTGTDFLYGVPVVVSLLAILTLLYMQTNADKRRIMLLLHEHPVGVLHSLLAFIIVAACYMVFIEQIDNVSRWAIPLFLVFIFSFMRDVASVCMTVVYICLVIVVCIWSFVKYESTDSMWLFGIGAVSIAFLFFISVGLCMAWYKHITLYEVDESNLWSRFFSLMLWFAWWFAVFAVLPFGVDTVEKVIPFGSTLLFASFPLLLCIVDWVNDAAAAVRLEPERHELTAQDAPGVQFHL